MKAVRTSPPAVSAASGFTLMELLVAMSLAAIVGVAVYSLSSGVIGAYDQAKRIRRDDYGQKMLLAILQDDLRGAFAGYVNDQQLAFRGDMVDESGDAFLQFATASSMDLTEPESMQSLYEVRYRIRRQELGEYMELVREERSFAGVDGDFPWREMVVIDDIEDISFEYLHPDSREPAAEWATDVAAKTGPRLPYGVRVGVAYAQSPEEKEFIVIVLPQNSYLYKARTF